MTYTIDNFKSESLGLVETAKIIRKALKLKFPGVKFSVRTERYAGGCAINVSWTDGPNGNMVDDVLNGFASKGFDGMIDLSYYKQSWLLPDGTALFAATDGTTGSMGSVPHTDTGEPIKGARLVSFGADYVTGSREMSEGFTRRAFQGLKRKFADYEGVERLTLEETSCGQVYINYGGRYDGLEKDARAYVYGRVSRPAGTA